MLWRVSPAKGSEPRHAELVTLEGANLDVTLAVMQVVGTSKSGTLALCLILVTATARDVVGGTISGAEPDWDQVLMAADGGSLTAVARDALGGFHVGWALVLSMYAPSATALSQPRSQTSCLVL